MLRRRAGNLFARVDRDWMHDALWRVPAAAGACALGAGALLAFGTDLHRREFHRQSRRAARCCRAWHRPCRAGYESPRSRTFRARRRATILASAPASMSMPPRRRGRQGYRMYSYVAKELRDVVAAAFPVDPSRAGIFGHSMGGHGALTIALKNPRLVQVGLGLCADMLADALSVGREGACRVSRHRPRAMA